MPTLTRNQWETLIAGAVLGGIVTLVVTIITFYEQGRRDVQVRKEVNNEQRSDAAKRNLEDLAKRVAALSYANRSGSADKFQAYATDLEERLSRHEYDLSVNTNSLFDTTLIDRDMGILEFGLYQYVHLADKAYPRSACFDDRLTAARLVLTRAIEDADTDLNDKVRKNRAQ